MGQLQHNKTIVVDGPKLKTAVCGSTNYTWRGFFVQANNAVILRGRNAIKPFLSAFDDYWNNQTAGKFGNTISAAWTSLGLDGISAKATFSPHSAANAILQSIADDIGTKTTSCLFYSLAFLYQTPGVMLDAIKKVSDDNKLFVYGISDRKVGGIDLQKPDGNVSPVFPSALGKKLPEPFKSEPAGGSGNRMHHKFLVIDFNKPTARVYMGSYNFSAHGGHQERREPPAHSQPPDRGLLHDRSLAPGRSLSLSGSTAGSQDRQNQAAACQTTAPAGRRSLVVRILFQRAEDS